MRFSVSWMMLAMLAMTLMVEERAGGLGPGGNLSQRPGWKKQGRKVKQGQGCKAPTWPGVETTAGRDPEEEDVPTKTRKLS